MGSKYDDDLVKEYDKKITELDFADGIALISENLRKPCNIPTCESNEDKSNNLQLREHKSIQSSNGSVL